MRIILCTLVILVPVAAFAAERTRGSSVSTYAQQQNDAGTNYGQSWAKPRTEQPHNQPGPGSEVANDIQGHLANDDVVGNGRGYPDHK